MDERDMPRGGSGVSPGQKTGSPCPKIDESFICWAICRTFLKQTLCADARIWL